MNALRVESCSSVESFLSTAKPPVATKSRGRPKGSKNYLFNERKTLNSRRSHLKQIVKESVNVDSMLQDQQLIQVSDMSDNLQLSVLKMSWGRLKHMFTEAAYAKLQCHLMELRQMQNTCPVCGILYDMTADMVGCDICSRWYHFSCVGLRRAPAKRDWYCKSCRA